jgi:hypothetical protein
MRKWLTMCHGFVTARWACNLDKWRLAYRQTSRWSHSLIWSTSCCRVQTNPTDRSVQMVSSFSLSPQISFDNLFGFRWENVPGFDTSLEQNSVVLIDDSKSPALDYLIPIMLSMLGSQIGLASGKDLVWFSSAAIFLQFNVVTHYYAGQRSSLRPSNHPSRSV